MSSDERKDYRELLDGKLPPWVLRFVKLTGKAINRYGMIKKGDNVLLAVSGGKDSLALALALSLRRKWIKDRYGLTALMINWVEHPIPEEYRSLLKEYFSSLDIELEILDERQFASNNEEEYNCYICSRNRRKILFEYAQKKGATLIAMGHHLDDFVETALMNQCFHSKLAPMKCVQDFFDGKLKVIRPMILVHESVTKRLANEYDLPVVKPVCPYDQTNIRSKLKPIVKEISRINPLSREHIFNSFNG
ncbi:MAG: adenine nucleotide alpha hydrolase [Sphaerochaetaceae bacterium]|nr:adenine nucleotide alpha hydrolase [Sphaerochaetaceae bacterium]